MSYTRPIRNGANIPGDWWDSTFEKRIRISATNSSGSDLYDHLVSYTVSGGTTVDPGSMRVIEHTVIGGVDRTFEWRYSTAAEANNLLTLPAYISGGVITFKPLGRWVAGEVRYFNIYWSAVNGQTAQNFNHLEPVAAGWTATALAGTAGDVYALVVGGTTYSYVMSGGDTATIIATALKNLINAGTVATATSSAGVLTIKTTTPRAVFTVTSTGTTTPANLVVVSPVFFPVVRIGPDTGSAANADGSGNVQLGLPDGNSSTTLNRLALGRTGATEFLRLLHYRVTSDATDYGAVSATQTSIVVDGPTITVAGNMTFSTRAAGVDWAATYTAVYQNRLCSLAKSDGTNANNVIKELDLLRFTVTHTCQRAHQPGTGSSSGTTFVNYDVFSLEDVNANFSGNTTTAAGSQLTNWYYTAGALSSFAASANLSALPVNGLIIGSSGNTHSIGILINNVTLTGFSTNQPSAALKWFATGNPFPTLQIVGLTNSSTIPVGATIAYDIWYGHSTTSSPTTTGDNMTPQEMSTVLQNVGTALTPTLLATETFSASTLYQTMLKASNRAVDAVQWFQTNALALTGLAVNYAYEYNVQTAVVGLPDDDDGNYGEAYKLHGLCLRYLRTKESSLIPLIENQVNFHLAIEAAAVALYGSYWSGSCPYWYWPLSTSSGSTYTTDGGVASGVHNLVDPGMPGGVKGTVTYTQGQVKRSTSIDQSHMVAHALYAYLYLLRNEAAITANTTLRTNTLAYLGRMATFEADKFSADSCVIDNVYAICSGGTPTHNNGITTGFLNTQTPSTLATPYRGAEYAPWEDSNTDNQIVNASANSTTDYVLRAVYAPDSTNAGVVKFLIGAVMDFLTADLGQHAVTTTITGSGTPGTYPHGWNTRVAATGNNRRYNAGRTGDKHYIEIGSGGSRDHLSGRAGQRLSCIAFLALLNPGAIIPIEEPSLRSVPVLTALDDLARNISLYSIEPKTHAIRLGVPGYLGASQYKSQLIDSPCTGEWLFAVELWFMVQKAVAGSLSPATYYKFAGTTIGSASALAFGQIPNTATHAVAFGYQPVVYALDSSGYLDRTYNGNVTLSIKSGTGTGGAVLGGTLTVACVNGVATFAGLSIDLAGSGYQLHATSGSLTAIDSVAFTVG